MSRLALFQTTLTHECYPSFPVVPAFPFPGGVVDVVGVGVLEVGGDELVVVDVEGDADVEADTVGVALVGGASRVGVGDTWLGVGCADRAALVCGADSTLVPGALLLAGVARTDAVAGCPTLAGAAGEVEFAGGAWCPPELSSTATTAATPHSATPMPAAARR